MADQGNKQENPQVRRNPEEDVIMLFLEASLNIGIVRKSLTENPSGKGKVIEGGKNRVFLFKTNQDYKYYLGNFSIDKLESCKKVNNQDLILQGVGNDGKYAKKNLFHTKIEYTVQTGYVNYTNNWDNPLDNKDILTDINPAKNRANAFRYVINSNDTNNKIGSLKDVKFEIFLIKRCCLCGLEESHNNKLVYCQNDRNFFCTNCDKTWHEQKEKMSLNLHLRTNNFKYTLTYFGNCTINLHYNKPFQYFDEKTKQCFCVKCMDQFLNNPEKINSIIFIEDYLKVKSVKEDFLNSRINSVCEEINRRLQYAEDVWDNIDMYEKDYLQELEDDKNDNLKKMYDEGFARQTFLCCIFMEIQRIIKEIDSKIIFIKNQRNNVDVSTFLYMNQIYSQYMKNELSANLEYLCQTNLETSTKSIVTINDKDDKKYEMLKLEPFVDMNKDDYIMNDI